MVGWMEQGHLGAGDIVYVFSVGRGCLMMLGWMEQGHLGAGRLMATAGRQAREQ